MPRVEAAEEADAALWEQVIIDQATYEKQVKEGVRKGIEQNARMHCLCRLMYRSNADVVAIR
jgi:hypothetical protein